MLFVKLSICLLREAVHDNVKVYEIDSFYVFIYVQISFLSDIHKKHIYNLIQSPTLPLHL